MQYGYYAPALPDGSAPSTAQRILDATPLLIPGSAFGGWAAAYMQGVDWLDGRTIRQRDVPVDLVSDRLHRKNTGRISYRQAALPAAEITTIAGLPVTTPLRTAFDGARWSVSVEEAMVFLDGMLAFGRIDRHALDDYLESRTANGIERARQAAALCRPNVASLWESRLRYTFQVHAGLAEPMINVPLFDPHGTFLGIPDLFDPEAALAVEFDGEQHREREQHRNDNLREEGLEQANVTVVRADSLDILRDRKRLVTRIQDGRRRGLLRNRLFDRWTLTQPTWWLRRQLR